MLIIFPTYAFSTLPPKILTAIDAQQTNYRNIADNSGKMRWYCFSDKISNEAILVVIDNNNDGIYEMWDVSSERPIYDGKVSEGMVSVLLPLSNWYTGTVKQ